MIAPGMRQLPHLGRGARAVLFTALVIIATIVGWAAFAHSPAATDDTALSTPAPGAVTLRSVVYSVPAYGFDALYLRPMDGSAKPRLIASFPMAFGLHSHGQASPLGNRIAVLSMTQASKSYASLSVLALPSGAQTDIAGHFDYLSRLTWSPDGKHLVVTSPPAADGHIDVLDADIASGMTMPVAQFKGVFEVAPVGFSADGQRLFIVTVDKSGSTLWQELDGEVTRVATLSTGRTRDWSLSPDGARLAFVDVLGASDPGLVGRTLILATGVVTTTPTTGDELSPAWQPGSETPVFGGPGGQLHLTEPSATAAYPVPQGYSSDGTGLVATVYSATSDEAQGIGGSLELVSPNQRILLSDAQGSRFFGWVQDFD